MRNDLKDIRIPGKTGPAQVSRQRLFYIGMILTDNQDFHKIQPTRMELN